MSIGIVIFFIFPTPNILCAYITHQCFCPFFSITKVTFRTKKLHYFCNNPRCMSFDLYRIFRRFFKICVSPMHGRTGLHSIYIDKKYKHFANLMTSYKVNWHALSFAVKGHLVVREILWFFKLFWWRVFTLTVGLEKNTYIWETNLRNVKNDRKIGNRFSLCKRISIAFAQGTCTYSWPIARHLKILMHYPPAPKNLGQAALQIKTRTRRNSSHQQNVQLQNSGKLERVVALATTVHFSTHDGYPPPYPLQRLCQHNIANKETKQWRTPGLHKRFVNISRY